ncbi:PREDICTED: epidermal growth factor receptor kinase substrate 8-like isoform X2 [Nicrophorus vespilloides]|uniref:Epidermal growth factor receptor kinase substrate 8-like isoform X2 n=1 Tax=Nicrophorus vespilloides TaxID=110193 RepID=A0ABM1M551_NICVS|nr:PREDICTED: epidermal growth factor receptor kinase substrate 8-like isoform X2 [Nicrophorus vespilloides]
MAYHPNGYSGDERDLDRGDDRNPDDGDKPTYLMEHLATFTVNKETQYPTDGMRKLLQLEKSNGIWSQKMQLCLDRSWVLIMDYETGSVMERFPGKSIQEPTAFATQDPIEMYNNILVFIVSNSNPSYPPEMHIFQCQSISAQDLVEDLKDMQRGKYITRHRKSSNPPPSYKPAPQHVISLSREYRESELTSELTTNNDDNSSTTSEQYERDVTVLNHCFDDIEKFIARLQHAAAASRELERRRRTRKGKKSDNGDGMLTMRTKPPAEKEFFDIFQKFKLSFNLLAKLKAHIHDPNAPELVHFLFTPLALIVEASHDTYFDRHLPQKIVSPLLTREAINLLNNCVTSKETELWHSLGNAWFTPRDEWKGHVSAYHPVFLDKWSPDYPVVDELEPDKHRDSHDYDFNDYEPSQENTFMYDNRSNDPQKDLDHDPNMSASRSDISADSIERNGAEDFKREQEKWLDKLNKKHAIVVQVTYPRTANNDKELSVVRGEYLEILDDSRKWWKARNYHGQVAHVPHTIVSKVNYQTGIFNNPIYSQNRPESASDRFIEGQGDHPHVVAAAPADIVRMERIDSVPAPPPPPPPQTPITPTPTLKRIPKPVDKKPGEQTMQEELSMILPLLRERKRKDIDIKQTPEVYITQKSNPDEVQMWLQAKGFSDKIQKVFKGTAGHEILGMNRDHLEKISEEGKRLVSQLNIQKSVCQYKTFRSSELQAILAKAREKAEQ